MGQGIAALIAEARERATEDELKRATEWVERTFERFVESETFNGKTRGRLYVLRVVVTQEEIDRGMFRQNQEGWYHAQHMLTEEPALLYIDIILDDSIPDEDKVLAIAEYDKGAGHGYGPYFTNYPDLPWYVLSKKEIAKRKKFFEEKNAQTLTLQNIIMNPLTSEKAKTRAREALGIP